MGIGSGWSLTGIKLLNGAQRSFRNKWEGFFVMFINGYFNLFGSNLNFNRMPLSIRKLWEWNKILF